MFQPFAPVLYDDAFVASWDLLPSKIIRSL